MSNDFYVYVWKRPCGTPFYVGKGKRYRDTTEQGRNPIFRNIVAKIRASGEEPVVERIFDGVTENEAFAHEIALVAKYGRKNNGTGVLANLTDGGDGANGCIPSEATRAKISASLTGRIQSEQARAKLSAFNKGKVFSDETRAKLSAARKGRGHSQEARARMSAAHKGKVPSEESRVKMSVARKGKPLPEETRAKLSAAHKGKVKSEETRARIGAARRTAPPSPISQTGYKGVSFNAKSGTFFAKISVSGSPKRIGAHPTAEEAARAYDLAAYAAWGRDCYLNFPDEIPANDRPSPLADSEEPPPHACAA